MSAASLLARSFIGAALAGVLSHTATATENQDFDYETTRDLYDVCSVSESDPGFIPAVFGCRAFLEASVQYHDAVSDRKHLKRLICYSKTATISDARGVFLSWVEKHAGDPDLMNESPVVGVVRALAGRYPCD
jgi:hypothetical protein